MTVSIIAAVGRGGVIGKDNKLPWHMPADMHRFTQLTVTKPVVMGRKTFESIVVTLGKPLPNRLNIILTHNPNFTAPGNCRVVHSIEEALQAAFGREEVVVIGGERVFREFLGMPFVKTLYLTEIDGDFEGDASFPPLDPKQWQTVQEQDHPADEDNPHPYKFKLLVRK